MTRRHLKLARPQSPLAPQAPCKILMVHDVDDVGDLRLKARIEDVWNGPEDERRPVPVGKRKIAQKPGGEFQPETSEFGLARTLLLRPVKRRTHEPRTESQDP